MPLSFSGKKEIKYKASQKEAIVRSKNKKRESMPDRFKETVPQKRMMKLDWPYW